MIADDHALMAEGMSRLLAGHYEVVGIALDGRALLRDVNRLRPVIVVVDVAMPELNGIEATKRLVRSYPTIKVVVVTQHVTNEYLQAALNAGALGFVAKQTATSELLSAVRRASYGRVFITSLLPDAQLSATRGIRRIDSISRTLTSRQREVLQLVAEGKSGKEIAASLAVSLKTIEYHKHALMNELGLRTTADLTRYAITKGYVADASE